MDEAASSESKAVKPTSAELMLSLSHIQQLMPLLDYKPSGLAHLVPDLLLPLVPMASMSSADPLAVSMGLPGLTQAAQQDAIKRYREHVQHAFRIASELVLRLHDPDTPAAGAIQLAQQLMQQQGRNGAAAESDKDRILRVRKKRRLLLEQDRLLQSSLLHSAPAQHTTSAVAKAPQELNRHAEPPTSTHAIQQYLSYLRIHLLNAVPPAATPLVKRTKIRLVTFASPSDAIHSFTLELHIQPVLKAVYESVYPSDDSRARISAVRIVSYSEDSVSGVG